MKVVEGFDITSGEMVFATEEGDIISYENESISVVREGATLVKGMSVADDFIDRCISEGVLEEVVAESASILSFQSGKGYVLTKEGAEIAMGNRIRARAYLTNEGFEVTAEMLDNAADGKLVTL